MGHVLIPIGHLYFILLYSTLFYITRLFPVLHFCDLYCFGILIFATRVTYYLLLSFKIILFHRLSAEQKTMVILSQE